MDGNAPSFNGPPLTEIELNFFQNKVNIRYRDPSTGTVSDGLFCSANISGANEFTHQEAFQTTIHETNSEATDSEAFETKTYK
jgi:hypothetical protein